MKPHWNQKAPGWDQHLPSTELFEELLDTVLRAADIGPTDTVLDLGAGTGFLTIPVARLADRVFAVDSSPVMLDALRQKLLAADLQVLCKRADLNSDLDVPKPVDVVVSNYALHHLRDGGKQDLLRRCFRWMRPRGRIVIADMVVPLTLRPGQSAPLLRKVRSMASKGPAGWWRIAKNVARWAGGRGEYPASTDFWTRCLKELGFVDVNSTLVGRESGVVWGKKPSQ